MAAATNDRQDPVDTPTWTRSAAGPAHLRLSSILLVWLGGTLGTGSRYLLTEVLPRPYQLPLAVFMINIVGAFLLGAADRTAGDRRARPGRSAPRIRLMAGTGFLGGFTTYSALAMDSVSLLHATGRPRDWPTRSALCCSVRRPADWASAPAGSAFDEGDAMIIALLVSLAGGFGASARLIVDGLITSRIGSRVGAEESSRLSAFPVGTTVINVLGSLLLGLVFGLTQNELLTDRWESIIGTGFLGGFTTFSTASLETVRLLGRRRWWAGAACGVGMLVCAIAAATLGFAVGGLLGEMTRP